MGARHHKLRSGWVGGWLGGWTEVAVCVSAETKMWVVALSQQ